MKRKDCRPGKNFIKKARKVYSSICGEKNHTSHIFQNQSTRRGIVRHLESCIKDSELTHEIELLYKKLAKRASKDPLIFDCFGGTYLDGKPVNTSKIFTDDINVVRDILKSSDTEDLSVFMQNETTHIEELWDYISLEGITVDRFTAGGTRVDWVTFENILNLDTYVGDYFMVYIPDKLWCFYSLFEQVIESVVETEDKEVTEKDV